MSQRQPHTLSLLALAFQEERDTISQGVIRALIDSMGRRCQAVINSHGGHTPH